MLGSPRPCRIISHLRIPHLITPAKSLLTCKIAYPWIPGIRRWTSLGAITQPINPPFRVGTGRVPPITQSCPTLLTPWTAACQASLSITNFWSLLKLMPIELVMPFSHLILCSLLLLLSIFPSIRVFFNESVLCIRWPKDWSFSFDISPSNEYSGLISFRMKWFDLLAVQGTLKSLSPTPQFKSINSLGLSFLYGPTVISIHDY